MNYIAEGEIIFYFPKKCRNAALRAELVAKVISGQLVTPSGEVVRIAILTSATPSEPLSRDSMRCRHWQWEAISFHWNSYSLLLARKRTDHKSRANSIERGIQRKDRTKSTIGVHASTAMKTTNDLPQLPNYQLLQEILSELNEMRRNVM